MNHLNNKISSQGEDLMNSVGALKEAKEGLQEELNDQPTLDAEEIGSVLGRFLKGLLSVFKL